MPVRFDTQRQAVVVSGRTKVLPEKSWQVLTMLRARAPEVVSRREIIDSVWLGNELTGEKGLNQALWSIRAALGDDAKCPQFIRTVPRVGYQWVYRNRALVTPKTRAAATSALVSLCGLAALVLVPTSTPLTTDREDSAPRVIATTAYLVKEDIVFETEHGCRGILKNAGNNEIGEPVLSDDGSRVAFTMTEDNHCRLVMVELTDGHRSDFGACPADST